jgi:RNA polymerase sigma factor (sigma-70 family)
MATGPTTSVLPGLRRTALLRDGGGLTDGQLLEAFAVRRDEAAFEALVRRHGAMVLGVCRRVLRNGHDAEDAFQATFLVLARKAASVRQRELVGNWLYGAAYRAALEARAATRRAKETSVRDLPEPRAADAEDGWRELRPLLDKELNRLPDKYRVPVVLCELEGRTRKEVARQLGIPEGTLSSRLAAARKMLARRLGRHGRGLSVAAVTAALAQGGASACVPAPLVESAVRQAAAGGDISARVASLTEGVLKAMLLTKLKIVGVLLLVAALAGAAGVFANPGPAARPRVLPGASARQGEKPQAGPAWKPRLAVKVAAGTQIFAAAVAPDGKVVAYATNQGIKLLDAVTGNEIALVDTDCTLAAAISPDGKKLATGHINAIKLWDAATGNNIATLAEGTGNVAKVAFSPDGKMLAAAEGGAVRLWDTATNKELRRLGPDKPKGYAVFGLAFSPDGKTLASADGQARTVKLWDIETGKKRKTLTGHTKNVMGVAFAPDGKTLVSSGGEGRVKLWDVDTGKERAELTWRTAGGHSLAFAPDGKVLATAGGGSNNVMLWDAKTGKDLGTLDHAAYVWSVAFSRDGRTLVTAGDDAVIVWEAKK